MAIAIALHGHPKPVGRCPAVEDDGGDRVCPESGLPAAGLVQQIGMKPSAHAGSGVDGIPSPVAHCPPHGYQVGQVAIRQALVLERLTPGRTP